MRKGNCFAAVLRLEVERRALLRPQLVSPLRRSRGLRLLSAIEQ